MPAVATAAGLPSRLGKYELLLPLAAGGMARIYIGRSTGIGSFERHVVLKMITPERANDLTAVNMFLDEARLAASLNHQNVAQVFEVGEDVGIHYLAMEYVHGQDLRAVLAKAGSQGTRIPLELALTVVAGAAAGLHHAHERRGPDGTPLGIVHRDVSPSNIMIGYDGAVKLLDFGIAKATARSVETQSGIIKGKFAYMAPEQCRGRDVDRRSDVFSLGIILYEISTQHRCFRADSDFDTMHRIVTGDVVRPTRLVQGYPQALEAIVMKALATDAAQRYQSSGLLLEALEAFAVSSRMSLSTMGLGRFMRDMFGEVQEPWLNTAATKILQPIVTKENTISSTDGKGRASAPHADGIPDEDARFPESDGINSAAKTTLDLPREGEREPEAAIDAGWGNAKAYPGSQPSGEALAMQDRPSYPPGAVPQRNTPQHIAQVAQRQSQPHVAMPPDMVQRNTPQGMLAHPPHGTLPPAELPLPPPPQQFNVPGSGSSPSHPSLQGYPQIPSTKHGYTSGAMSRSDASYPRYEVPPMDAMTGDVQLTPNRRPLFIGIGIVLVGAAVMLMVSLSGGSDDQPTASQTETEEVKQMDNTSPEMATKGSDDDAVDDSMVSIVIHSDPPGADVLIAGGKIGVTPFDNKIKRGTKVQQLTVQKDGYVPFQGKIDLAGDYENPSIKLVRVEDAAKNPEEPKAPEGTEKNPTKSGTEKSGTEKSGTEKTGTEKTGTEKTSTKPGEKAGTEKTSTKTGAEKSGTEKTSTKTGAEKTSTKTGTEKSGTEKTSTKTGTEKTSTKTGTEKTGTEKTGTEKANTGTKKEPCQPPGANLDPFGPPVCKG